MNHATRILLVLPSIALIGGIPLRAAPRSLEEAVTAKRPSASLAEDEFHDHNTSLIIIKSDEGAGTGFICKSGNSTFLYTNIHVVADLRKPTFTRLDGVVVSTGGADVAAGRDIARVEVKNPPKNPLEVTTNLNDSVRIGDEVFVPGNSGGGGVVTGMKGAIVGIGPDRIEVSAPFIPGNSGSPIIHVKTGKVIGIATYLTIRKEDPTKNSAFAVRHFGYRIDNAAAWERVDGTTFRQDADSVKQVSALTGDIFNFLRALKAKHLPTFATETLRQPASEWIRALQNHELTKKGRHAATANFIRALRQIVAADVLALEPRLHYTFFREEMAQQREIRKRLYDALNPNAAGL